LDQLDSLVEPVTVDPVIPAKNKLGRSQTIWSPHGIVRLTIGLAFRKRKAANFSSVAAFVPIVSSVVFLILSGFPLPVCAAV
jgi:hypothetical protein